MAFGLQVDGMQVRAGWSVVGDDHPPGGSGFQLTMRPISVREGEMGFVYIWTPLFFGESS